MPDQQQSASSAQASRRRSSSNTPPWDYAKPRRGKVMAEQLMYHSKEFPGYIQILPDDNKGPLKDEIGKLTTDDDLGYETRKDVPLVVENSILDKAIEDNRQQAIDKADADREEFDEGTAVEEFFFKVGDPVLLEYDSKGHLTAVKKINEESSGLVEGVGEE